MSKKLMAIFAHPDDESFGPGGTLARYSTEGVEITLICATRGEAGKWGSVTPGPGQPLGEVREKELQASAEVLGIGEVIFLDYIDKSLNHIPFYEAVAKIEVILDKVKPDVVITFPPDGISGHPDHKAIHKMAKEAFKRYSLSFHERNQPRLYYICFPPEAPMLRGIAPRLAAVKPNMAIDVANYWDAKVAAIECHKTQSFSKERLFAAGEETIKLLFRREYYFQAYPAGPPHNPEDLFGGPC